MLKDQTAINKSHKNLEDSALKNIKFYGGNGRKI